MGSSITLPEPSPSVGSTQAPETRLKLTNFPPEILSIITAQLKYDEIFPLLLVGNRQLVRDLTTRRGVEAITVVNYFPAKYSWDYWHRGQSLHTPTRLFRSLKSIEMFRDLLSFSYCSGMYAPSSSRTPLDDLRLPRSLTFLKFTTTEYDCAIANILGPGGAWLPNLQTLKFHNLSLKNLSNNVGMLVFSIPRTVTDLELVPMQFELILNASENLPPNLTRLCLKRPDHDKVTRVKRAFRPTEAQYHSHLPSSITDLQVLELELLPVTTTSATWFLNLYNITRFSVSFMPLNSLQYLPKSITALSIGDPSTFRDDSKFSHFPNLTSFAYGLSGTNCQHPPRFPVIPSLTELTVRFKGADPLLKWIEDPKAHPKLTILNMPFTEIKESLLRSIPPQIKILELDDVLVEGHTIPDGAESIDSVSDIQRGFWSKRWPFVLRLHSSMPIKTGENVHKVPNSLTSLTIPHAVQPANLPRSLTYISHLRLEVGCIKYLPHTLTCLEAKVHSDPMKNKSFITSADLFDLPPNLHTLRFAVICLLSDTIPDEPVGGYQQLRLPIDAEQNLQSRFPNCDMSTCIFDPLYLLRDIATINSKSITLEGGCFYANKNFQFLEGLLELDTHHMTFSEDGSLHNTCGYLPNLPKTLESLAISGKIAETFAFTTSPGLLPCRLRILHIFFINGYTGDPLYVGIEQLSHLELMTISGSSPWRSKPIISLPRQLKFNYMTGTVLTWVGSARSRTREEIELAALVTLDQL